MDASSAFQPYVGASLNYTIFVDEEFTDANKQAGLTDLELDNSLGLTAQLGADYKIKDKWHINASVIQLAQRDNLLILNGSKHAKP